MNSTGADGSFFTFVSDFSFLDKKNSTTKATVIRFDQKGAELSRYENISLKLIWPNRPYAFANMFYAVDWKGNFVALTDNGLTSLRPDGTVRWQLKELKVNDTAYDLFAMSDLLADSDGHLFVGLGNELICLNMTGQ
jgi:hypothetical protein